MTQLNNIQMVGAGGTQFMQPYQGPTFQDKIDAVNRIEAEKRQAEYFTDRKHQDDMRYLAFVQQQIDEQERQKQKELNKERNYRFAELQADLMSERMERGDQQGFTDLDKMVAKFAVKAAIEATVPGAGVAMNVIEAAQTLNKISDALGGKRANIKR